MRISPGLGQTVVGLQLDTAAASFGPVPRGELVAGRQDHFGAEAIEQCAPALIAWQSGPLGADALGGHDRNQAGLWESAKAPRPRSGRSHPPWQTRGTGYGGSARTARVGARRYTTMATSDIRNDAAKFGVMNQSAP